MDEPIDTSAIEDYWTTTGVQYRESGGVLTPIETSNPTSVWDAGDNEFEYQLLAPPGNADTQFQRLISHQGNNAFNFSTEQGGTVTPHVIGEFDPDKLPGFNPLSAVPLETYYPPVVTGSNAASRKALKNQPLGPTMNLGGYVAQPPLLLTSLTAMEQMLSEVVLHRRQQGGPSCTRYTRDGYRSADQCDQRPSGECARLRADRSSPHPCGRHGDQEGHRAAGGHHRWIVANDR